MLKKNVLILGSNGFIGHHLFNKLSTLDNINLATFTRSPFRGNTKLFTPYYGDFNNERDLSRALNGKDLIYFFISETGPRDSWDNPIIEIEKILIPMVKLIELASKNGVKKIVFPSSGGTVYGIDGTLGGNFYATEEQPLRPISPYGIVKVTIENFLEFARNKHNISYDIYRISNVYGPELNSHKKAYGVIMNWLRTIKNGEEILIHGDGSAIKDYIYIDDVVNTLCLSLTKDLTSTNIFNLGSGKSTSLNELVQILRETTNCSFGVKYIPTHKGDNPNVMLSCRKVAKEMPNYKLIDLSQGIKIAWEQLCSS